MRFTARPLPKREFKPINASGVRVERKASSFVFRQHIVPKKLSPQAERKVTNAFQVIRSLKSFVDTKEMKEVQAFNRKNRLNERMKSGEITPEQAKQMVAREFGAERMESLHKRWLTEFGNRTGRQVIDSGYQHGCGDIANAAKHLMAEAGIPCRIVRGTSMFTDRKSAEAAEKAGSGHAWNEVWNGRNWVPVDFGQRIIGFQPLKHSPESRWKPLAPLEVSSGEMLGVRPTGNANPLIHEISRSTMSSLRKRKLQF